MAETVHHATRGERPLNAVTVLFCARATLAIFIVLTTSRLLGILYVGEAIFDVMPILEIVLFCATVVTFFLWMNRSSKNASALGARNMMFGPNARVWVFVPVLNLLRPYQAVKELYEVSANGRAVPGVLPVGWGAFVAAILFQVAAHQARAFERDESMMALYADLKMIATLLGALAALAAWRVVVRIFEAQEQARRARVNRELARVVNSP